MAQVVTHNTAGIFCQNGVGLQKACIQSLKCSEWKKWIQQANQAKRVHKTSANS